MSDTLTAYKRQAAERAVEQVRSGMVVGLGHGTTALFALRRIAELLQRGELHDLLGVPCSTRVEADARQLGIPLTTLEEHPVIDLTIDGADEVCGLDAIKGGGGALLREKIVAQASRRVIIIIDESKLSPVLGMLAPVPVEVTPFGWRSQAEYLASLGANWVLRLREDGTLFNTDQGNFIVDCNFGAVPRSSQLAVKIKQRAGIVEHGLYLHLATEVIVAGSEGIRRIVRAKTEE